MSDIILPADSTELRILALHSLRHITELETQLAQRDRQLQELRTNIDTILCSLLDLKYLLGFSEEDIALAKTILDLYK